jgi:hypothetical protein
VAAQLGPRRGDLKESWLAHLRDENVPLPITVPEEIRPAQERMVGEAELLRQAGFTALEVPMRLYQSAVVVAEKQDYPDDEQSRVAIEPR